MERDNQRRPTRVLYADGGFSPAYRAGSTSVEWVKGALLAAAFLAVFMVLGLTIAWIDTRVFGDRNAAEEKARAEERRQERDECT
ncbi:hypothetical protein [Actinomadura yumaensis]|uniref:Uncharacterized protein n=1 Tax=Actinomadura yumaensis TaxID=111807 RepID=A0ABW2CNX4_9ACTN